MPNSWASIVGPKTLMSFRTTMACFICEPHGQTKAAAIGVAGTWFLAVSSKNARLLQLWLVHGIWNWEHKYSQPVNTVHNDRPSAPLGTRLPALMCPSLPLQFVRVCTRWSSYCATRPAENALESFSRCGTDTLRKIAYTQILWSAKSEASSGCRASKQ